METQAVAIDISVWRYINQINKLLDQPLPWSTRLEQVDFVLLEALKADGLWLMTFSPLPLAASGIAHTPLTNNPHAFVQITDETPQTPDRLPDTALISRVVQQKQPIFLSDETISDSSDLAGVLFSNSPIQPTVVLPLLKNKLVVGVLIMAHTSITSADEPFLMDVGQWIGTMLLRVYRLEETTKRANRLTHQVSDLHDSLQKRVHEVETINKIVLQVNAGHGLSETAQLIVTQFKQLFEFSHLSVALVDESGPYVRQWVFNEYGCNEQPDFFMNLADSSLAPLLSHYQPHIESDISQRITLPYEDHEMLFHEGVKSIVTVPYKTAKGLRGGLNLGHNQVGTYTDYELNLLKQVTPHIAVMIESARMVDMMEQHTNKLKMLNHLGEMLVSITDPKRIVDITLSMLPRLLSSDVQGIIVASEDGAYMGAAIPYNFHRSRKTLEEIHETFVEMVDKNLPTKIISTKRIAGNMPVPNHWEPVTVLSLPILTRQGALGLIYIASGSEEQLNNDFLRIFSLAASQLSAVVENASLFRQVEQERARLAAILSSSTDAIMVVHRDGRVVLDNPAAWQVMGVETSQSGNLLADCTTNQPLIDLFEQAMHGGKPNGEIPLDDGSTLFANLSPVSIGQKGIIGWIATMQDVSYFKELDGLKNEFVNAVSHDLRSPLSSILIATHMLPKIGSINDSQKDLLTTIERKVRTMSRLIHDLLDVGKIEAGIDMDMQSISVIPILEDVISSFETQAQNKSIRLNYQLDASLPNIAANETRLHQVFNNLIGNAIKYTPDTGLVTVKAFRHEQEIRIHVIDTGLGIPAADQPHIFEKFYRVRGDHVKSIKGTGLGLAITKSIVEKHNGRIWLESVFGEGSTFITALPILENQQ